jgi:hypothetical protein
MQLDSDFGRWLDLLCYLFGVHNFLGVFRFKGFRLLPDLKSFTPWMARFSCSEITPYFDSGRLFELLDFTDLDLLYCEWCE